MNIIINWNFKFFFYGFYCKFWIIVSMSCVNFCVFINVFGGIFNMNIRIMWNISYFYV